MSELSRVILITICKMAQFNYTRSDLLGYDKGSTDFLSGNLRNKSLLSWTGLNDSLSFNDTLEYLYHSYSEIGNVFSEVPTSNHFFLPFGLCTVGRGYPRDILVNNEFIFYIRNPGEYKVQAVVFLKFCKENYYLLFVEHYSNHMHI